MYIQEAKLNGRLQEEFWFGHEDFSKGGILELWMGPTPNKAWGNSELPN